MRRRPQRHSPSRPAQRGVATLVVVMVLFFVIALTAAYTSRNMIFEQKTSANQYRSTIALEAAEAGVEWALAMLNGGLINDSCGTVTPTTSFQQRYLEIAQTTDPATNGRVSNRTGRPTGAPGNWPACVFDGSRWNNPQNCACPVDTAASPTAPTGNDLFPAFRVWPADPALVPVPTRPGVLLMQANGCTKMPAGAGEKCLDRSSLGDVGDGLSSLNTVLALRNGIGVTPAAAVTARLAVTPEAPGTTPRLAVVNTDAATNGVTVDTGGAIGDPARFAATSLPGVPGERSLIGDDVKLSGLNTVAAGGLTAAERMFVAQFGMRRLTYREQPGLRRCPAPGSATCTAAGINALLAQNPNRIIWVDGALTLDAAVGSVGAPVLLVIDGDRLTLGNGADITGFVYLTGGAAAGPVTVELPTIPVEMTGALVSETSLATSSAGTDSRLTVTYSPTVLNLLRTTYGSWVRIPGSWRDFTD